MEPVIHFEMPYKNAQRAAQFYQTTFGWKTQQLGKEMDNYLLLTTAEQDAVAHGHRGAISGGMFAPNPAVPNQVSVVIGVADIRSSMQKIIANGGQVHGEPIAVPGIGLHVAFTDTEGNRNSILQPSM
jgi:predicted enzyme related to lactoylglutathione lyase